MLLSIPERLIMLGVLPREGDFVTLKIIRDLHSALSFTEEELKSCKIVQSGDQISWDVTAPAKDVPIGEKATDIIVGALKRLNDAKLLTVDHMGVYERFIPS